MRTWHDILTAPQRRSSIVFALVLLASAWAWAQPVEEPPRLRAALEESYEITETTDGLLLVPRDEELGLDSVEVGGGRLRIEGSPATAAELAARVGRDEAKLLMQLVSMDAETLHLLFGFTEPEELELEALSAETEEALEEFAERRRELEEEIRARRDELREREREARDRLREVSARRHRSTDARVVMGSAVEVAADESTGDVVAIGGSVTVYGEVFGDAVAIGGPVQVHGRVHGDVVSVGGGVRLYEGSEVHGDVATVGGRLIRESGSSVDGEIVEVGLWEGLMGPWWQPHKWTLGRDYEHDFDYFNGALADLLGSTMRAVVLGLVGLLLLVLARRPVEKVAAVAAAEPWKAGVVGLLSFIFFVPLLLAVVILLCISIIGIPLLLLLPFAVLGFLLAALFGFLSVAYQLGRWSESRFGWRTLGPVAALVIGLLWLQGWSVTADLVDMLDSSRDFAGFLVLMLALFGFLVKLAGWSVGLGAVLLARKESAGTATLALPPPPPSGETPPGGGAGAPDALVPEATAAADEGAPASGEDPWDDWTAGEGGGEGAEEEPEREPEGGEKPPEPESGDESPQPEETEKADEPGVEEDEEDRP